MLFLKQWSKYTRLDAHITTYALTMMVIYFLQLQKALPTVLMLKEVCGVEGEIDGWETLVYKPAALMNLKLVNVTDKIKILKDFYQFYMNFDFAKLVVCPLLGSPITKQCMTDAATIPPEMHCYKVKLMENEACEKFRAESAMCVQDPFDLAHNLTKALQERNVERFQALCKLSFEQMRK